MSELDKARKADLIEVAKELEIEVQSNFTVAKLRDLIKQSPRFEKDFINSLVKNVIEERNERNKQEEFERNEKIRLEELAEKRRADELEIEKKKLEINLELEKLKLQSQHTISSGEGSSSNQTFQPETKMDTFRLLPNFNPETDDITLFLVLLERQLKLSKVPEDMWVSYLLSVVPSSISTLVARESEENALNFPFVKNLLLRRFKISAGKFRQYFFSHRKTKESTWRDYYFELRAYFENWLKELKVDTFDALQDLIISDQIKKRVSPDCKEHLLDDWEDLNSPITLAEKLDAYDNIRPSALKKDSTIPTAKREGLRKDNSKKTFQSPPAPARNALSCYGCGKPGFIKKKCPNCSPAVKKENIDARQLLLYSCNTAKISAPNVPVTVCNKKVLVCADTGANRSIAGERMYKLFIEAGITLKAQDCDVTLADGSTQSSEILSAIVPVDIEGRVFQTEFIVLPNAKNNRTLLGMDFLHKANIVLDTANKTWYFKDKYYKRYPFIEEYASENTVPVATVKINPYALREDEGKRLKPKQRDQLNALLEKFEKCFHPGGEATPYAEHRINTGDSAPIAMPPYRMTPTKKEILKKELDELIANGIVEECESPYASPVVLVPKPDGSMRLCIDYRKLNAVTVPDTYPLPRMDDLLHEAKHTSFMSTLDL